MDYIVELNKCWKRLNEDIFSEVREYLYEDLKKRPSPKGLRAYSLLLDGEREIREVAGELESIAREMR